MWNDPSAAIFSSLCEQEARALPWMGCESSQLCNSPTSSSPFPKVLVKPQGIIFQMSL